MTDQSDRGDGGPGVPDTDPDTIDPAGDVADLLEDQLTDADLGEDTDADDLRAFIHAAERGEFGPVDPGLEAQVRIARAVLEAATDGDGDGDPDSDVVDDQDRDQDGDQSDGGEGDT